MYESLRSQWILKWSDECFHHRNMMNKVERDRRDVECKWFVFQLCRTDPPRDTTSFTLTLYDTMMPRISLLAPSRNLSRKKHLVRPSQTSRSPSAELSELLTSTGTDYYQRFTDSFNYRQEDEQRMMRMGCGCGLTACWRPGWCLRASAFRPERVLVSRGCWLETAWGWKLCRRSNWKRRRHWREKHFDSHVTRC